MSKPGTLQRLSGHRYGRADKVAGRPKTITEQMSVHLVDPAGAPRRSPGRHWRSKLAAEWGISRTRVWQIEQRALRKIRVAFEEEAKARGLTIEEWLAELRGV